MQGEAAVASLEGSASPRFQGHGLEAGLITRERPQLRAGGIVGFSTFLRIFAHRWNLNKMIHLLQEK